MLCQKNIFILQFSSLVKIQISGFIPLLYLVFEFKIIGFIHWTIVFPINHFRHFDKPSGVNPIQFFIISQIVSVKWYFGLLNEFSMYVILPMSEITRFKQPIYKYSFPLRIRNNQLSSLIHSYPIIIHWYLLAL